MNSETGPKISLQRGGQSALRIALGYILLSAIWIVVSDHLLLTFFRDPDLITNYQTAKGWVFILLSGGLIFVLARREYFGWMQSAHALADANRALRVLNACNHALVHFRDEQELLHAICQVITEEGGYRMAWVGYVIEDGGGGSLVQPVAWYGFEDGYLEKKRITLDETTTDRGPSGEALRTRQPVVVRNILMDPRFVPWREEALLRGYSSVISLPLEAENRLLGILSIYHRQVNVFNSGEVKLLVELAQDLSYGIAAIRSHNLRLEVEERLSESRRRFQSLVENAPMGIAISSQGILRYVNPAFVRMFAYQDESQLVGRPVIELLAPELRSEVNRRINRRELGEQVPMTQQLTGLRRDGSRFYLRSQICLLHWEGAPASMGFFTDITQSVQYEENLRQQNQRLSALRKIDKAIGASMDLRVTLSVLLDQVLIELQVDAASIRLLNPLTHNLEVLAFQGFRMQGLEPIHLFSEPCAPVRAVLERQPQHFSRLRQKAFGTFTRILEQEGFNDYVATPLITKGKVHGVLEVYQRSDPPRPLDWHDFLDLMAGEAAIAIENANLFEKLQRSNLILMREYDAAIETMAKVIELRCPDSFGHSDRLVDMTLRLARQMGLSDGQLGSVRRGALLHDIGMLAIPDAVLYKASQLNDAEWGLIRQHPEMALNLLSSAQFLREAIDIPYCHHERWDGSGYPRALKGEQIPLAARIFSVVDVWDSLQSERPYRPAWPAGQALDYLRQQAGVAFDPQVIEQFVRLLAEPPAEMP
jgi:PAS domain S-box-containing protein